MVKGGKPGRESGLSDAQRPFRTDFTDRLGVLLDKFDTRGEAAEIADVGTNQLQRYLRGEATPPIDVVARLAKAKSISLDWLWSGEGVSGNGEGDFVPIPIWDGEASSGHGAFPVAGEVRGTLAFSRAWLDSISRGPIERLQVVFNRGHSNEPDIRDGDAMLVDCSIERLQADDYYVFDEGGVLLVKMIERLVGGGVVLKARNVAEYEPRTLSRLDAEQLTIFGRVLWRGGAV